MLSLRKEILKNRYSEQRSIIIEQEDVKFIGKFTG
jgi:hypothetical protein